MKIVDVLAGLALLHEADLNLVFVDGQRLFVPCAAQATLTRPTLRALRHQEPGGWRYDPKIEAFVLDDPP